VQKNPRRSSDSSSEFSSGQVSFAKKQRRSFEGSSQYSSRRGSCAEGPEKVVRRLVWILVQTRKLCRRTREGHLILRLNSRPDE
jgi:hypothetical protein